MNEIKRLLDRPIAFQRSFVTIGGSVNAALFLSQAFYWSNRTDDPDGWFYKTQLDWEKETGLTRREQDGARAKLKAIGIIEEELKSIPARLFYRINIEALLQAMHQTAKQDALGGNDAPNRQTVSTESPSTEHETANHINIDYTEITSETTLSASEQEEAIYQLYPRKVGKRAALKAIQNAVKRLVKSKEVDTPIAARRLLYSKTKAYAAAPAGQESLSDVDYRPHPATWFNQDRFLDDKINWQKLNGGSNGRSSAQSKQDATIAAANSLIAKFRGVGNSGTGENSRPNGRASERGTSCIDGERVAGHSD